MYLKQEEEEIGLQDGENLPSISRTKIGTLKLDESVQGTRIGEGSLGVALWSWQSSETKEIYITIFPKHDVLISLVGRFGFKCVGENKRGENIYLRSRERVDFTTPYTSFPFIRGGFTSAGLIPINQEYHDQLFPYSELASNQGDVERITAGNGVSKIFIGFPYQSPEYAKNQPVLIYRIFTGEGSKAYKSVVSSFATITEFHNIKRRGNRLKTLDEYLQIIGNKSAFSQEELTNFYNQKANIVIIEMVYNGFFGKGNNVTYRQLDDSNLFYTYPYQLKFSEGQFKQVLKMGGKNVHDVIID